jgi:hypothetical protein
MSQGELLAFLNFNKKSLAQGTFLVFYYRGIRFWYSVPRSGKMNPAVLI